MNSVGMLCGQSSALQTDYAWILEGLPWKCSRTGIRFIISTYQRLMTMDVLVKVWKSFPTFNA
jgi:hypothetical protein